MGTYFLLVILIVIASFLMVGIVLIQESKGGGLASNFASYNQIGGVRKTTDFIEKATWGLAAFMVVVSIVCAYVAPKNDNASNALDQAVEAPIVLFSCVDAFFVNHKALYVFFVYSQYF